MTFGPWIQHNGQYVPHLVGRIVDAVSEASTGKIFRTTVLITTGEGGSWNWDNAPTFTRVIRYRIRKPRGLTILEEIATLKTNPERSGVSAHSSC